MRRRAKMELVGQRRATRGDATVESLKKRRETWSVTGERQMRGKKKTGGGGNGKVPKVTEAMTALDRPLSSRAMSKLSSLRRSHDQSSGNESLPFEARSVMTLALSRCPLRGALSRPALYCLPIRQRYSMISRNQRTKRKDTQNCP
jgi:hypothetical protein